MWPYWLIFSLPALASLSSRALRNTRRDGSRRISVDALWVLVLLVVALLIGFRDRVGGDWFNYFYYIMDSQFMTLGEALARTDPAYWALNMLSVQQGFGIVGVNLFCGLVFATGLVVYCRSMPRPWLALAVAVPYMLVVVAMGYSRQGVALGFTLIGLVALGRRQFLWFIFWVFVAAAFHRSAVLVAGIALLSLDLKKIYTLPVLLASAFLLYSTFLEDSAERLVTIYIDEEMESTGALIRLGMNVIPAALFLRYRKRFEIAPGEGKLYTIMSLLAVASFVALMAGLVPSTALDRAALYLIPLQVFVFSHLPDVLGRRGGRNQLLTLAILIFYAAVLFVWLNFAVHSRFWVPYRMFPPLDILEAVRMGR